MPTSTVMTRSITAQMRAAAAAATSAQTSQAQRSSRPEPVSNGTSPHTVEQATQPHPPPPPPSTPPSLRTPLGSFNSSHHNGGHKRHQSLSPSPSGHENGGRAVTPPHTPPKLVHQNGHASPHRGGSGVMETRSREASPQGLSSSRCHSNGINPSAPAPKSPPTPHRIKLLEEKENDKKPQRNLNKTGLLSLVPASQQQQQQQNGHHKADPPVGPARQPAPRPTITTTATTTSSTPTKKTLANAAGDKSNQTKLTSFFPIRRSERRPKTEVEAKQQKSLEDRLLSNSDADLGLKIQYYAEKGRGVTSVRPIVKGDFVVEYSGDLIDVKAAKERENKYAMDLSKGCYMYYFKANNRQYCIDATSETGRLGRLVNHSRLHPNLQTKVVVVAGSPRLILVAKRDIEPGEELLYDYGDRSKESLEAHPWLAL